MPRQQPRGPLRARSPSRSRCSVQCVRMPYACTRKTDSEDEIDVLVTMVAPVHRHSGRLLNVGQSWLICPRNSIVVRETRSSAVTVEIPRLFPKSPRTAEQISITGRHEPGCEQSHVTDRSKIHSREVVNSPCRRSGGRTHRELRGRRRPGAVLVGRRSPRVRGACAREPAGSSSARV